MKDFITAAFPWVVLGIAIAVACAVYARKKNTKQADSKDAEKENGLAMGFTHRVWCLGVAFGTLIGSVTDNQGLWMPLGLSIGMLFGILFSTINKGDDEK